MAISNRQIQKELVKFIQNKVGHYLYQYSNGTPAVLLANGKNPTPKYPFITVDKAPTFKPYNHKVREGWLNEDDYGIEQLKILQFTVNVYGGGEHDIGQIAEELCDRLKMTSGINYMQKFETHFYEITNPLFTTPLLNDEYREVYSFVVKYSVYDQTVDTENGGEITAVEVDTTDDEGGLYRGFDDDEPLEIDTGLITK